MTDIDDHDWAAPAEGSSERAAYDTLDAPARRLVAAWHENDPAVAFAISSHPDRATILAALGYAGRGPLGL